MAITQVEIDREHTRALDKIAESYGKSRRQWCAEYLTDACDRVPGLMDAVRKELAEGYLAPIHNVEMGKKEEKASSDDFRDTLKQNKGYRFRYLDESKGFIDGYGTGPKAALLDATGRPWTTEEYYETFMPTPDYITP